MGTKRIEKKTTRGYIIGVLRFIELICMLEFAQIPSIFLVSQPIKDGCASLGVACMMH